MWKRVLGVAQSHHKVIQGNGLLVGIKFGAERFYTRADSCPSSYRKQAPCNKTMVNGIIEGAGINRLGNKNITNQQNTSRIFVIGPSAIASMQRDSR